MTDPVNFIISAKFREDYPEFSFQYEYLLKIIDSLILDKTALEERVTDLEAAP